MLEHQTAEVIPLTGINATLTYAVPEALREKLAIGSYVEVPLGRRRCFAVVCAVPGSQKIESKRLKNIMRLVHAEPVMTAELIKLGFWIQRYYAASMHVVFEMMLPASVRKSVRPKTERLLSIKQQLSDDELLKLGKKAAKQAVLYRYLVAQNKVLQRVAVLKHLKLSDAVCEALVQKGIIEGSGIAG